MLFIETTIFSVSVCTFWASVCGYKRTQNYHFFLGGVFTFDLKDVFVSELFLFWIYILFLQSTHPLLFCYSNPNGRKEYYLIYHAWPLIYLFNQRPTSLSHSGNFLVVSSPGITSSPYCLFSLWTAFRLPLTLLSWTSMSLYFCTLILLALWDSLYNFSV